MSRGRVREIMRRLLVENGFKAGVLTDASGLPLVALPDGAAASAPAAMVAFIRRAFDQVRGQVGLREMEEVILRDEFGQRLVCRRVRAGQYDLVLAILVPPGREYAQATEQAVRQIRQAWVEP
ncbi:MAG: hypothetical protein N2508_16590 [Anaerolineae bacterium]|nr:hypothetical protein [Anaerolineae bacterium]